MIRFLMVPKILTRNSDTCPRTGTSSETLDSKHIMVLKIEDRKRVSTSMLYGPIYLHCSSEPRSYCLEKRGPYDFFWHVAVHLISEKSKEKCPGTPYFTLYSNPILKYSLLNINNQ